MFVSYLGNLTWLKLLANDSSENTFLSTAGSNQLRKSFDWPVEASHITPPLLVCPFPKEWLEEREGRDSRSWGSILPHAFCCLSPQGLCVLHSHSSLTIFIDLEKKIFNVVGCRPGNPYCVCMKNYSVCFWTLTACVFAPVWVRVKNLTDIVCWVPYLMKGRAATNDYFHYRLICRSFSQLISCSVHKMSENGEKCWSLFPKAKGDVLKCLVLSTTQRYSKD